METTAETAVGRHRVELTGDLADTRFPNLCASCGADPPAGDVPLEKLFRRSSRRRPNRLVYSVLRVPLCDGCLARHAAEQRPIGPDQRRALRRQWLIGVLPYVIPIGVQLYMIAQFGPKALAELPGLFESPPRFDAVVWGIAAGIFIVFLAMFLWLCVRAGRPLITGTWHGVNDAYVTSTPGPLGSVWVIAGPPTPTLGRVDFGDERFELFVPNHRRFTFASDVVAARFAEVNASRLWDERAPRVKRARRAEAVLFVILVLAAVAVMLRDLMTP